MMKRLVLLLALTSGCATELTNRQFAKYAVTTGAVVGALALMMVAGCGADAHCNAGGTTPTR